MSSIDLDAAGEFGFELRTCRWAERSWPPGDATSDESAVLVARQLGTRRRRWDTIVLECDQAGLEERARFGDAHLNSDLLYVVRHAPAEWSFYRDALPHPGYPWRYVRESIHELDGRGLLETRRDGNRIEIRRMQPYPSWVNRIVAIENKPDLDASAARALGEQLAFDVAAGIADEVWVATAQTGASVEPALFEDLPVAVGIVALAPEALEATVAWHPRTLDPSDPGTRILENPRAGGHDASAARFEYLEPAEKRTTRLAIAERAYERGYRSYVDTMRPDCRHFHLRSADQLLPWCEAKERLVTASECAGSCPAYEPEPPQWRTRGWPIEGGPGKRLTQLLAARRDRHRATR